MLGCGIIFMEFFLLGDDLVGDFVDLVVDDVVDLVGLLLRTDDAIVGLDRRGLDGGVSKTTRVSAFKKSGF